MALAEFCEILTEWARTVKLKFFTKATRKPKKQKHALYDGLVTEGLTQADAVQYAQKRLIQTSSFKHPYYWALFVFVGDWI